MLRVFSGKRILFFFLFDWVGTLFILWVAGNLRHLIGGIPTPLGNLLNNLNIQVEGAQGSATQFSTVPLPVYFLVFFIWPLFFGTLSVYEGRRNQTLRAELLNVLVAISISFTLLAGVLYFSYRETSRLILLLFVLMDILLLEGGRVVLWLYRRLNSKTQNRSRPVVIIGAGPVGINVAHELQKYAWASFEIAGFLDDDSGKQGKLIHEIPVLGRLEQAETVIKTHHIQHAVVALPLRAHERLVMVCKSLQKLGVQVHVVPDLFILSFPNAALDGFGGIPVISLGHPGLSGWSRVSKRVFDVVAVFATLTFLWPIFLVTAILIRLDSPGPIFYKQQRIGEYGKMFMMLKFRSMKVNADTSLHKAHVSRLIQENLTPEQLNGDGSKSLKIEKDPRVTRMGNFIRKTSIDELPQLFNVLRGEMSLVGPRPPLPYEVELYQDWHKRRMEILPGMTGLWQVKGRNRVSFDEMVRMDLDYIERQSLWLDFMILLQTPWALVNGKGAG